MNKKFAILAAAGALLGGIQEAKAVSFGFSSLGNAAIEFDGAGNFIFDNNAATADFQIANGTAALLQGDIFGTFSIGTISGPDAGGTSTAPVSGIGTFTIFDGATPLTATVTWDSISQKGTGSTLNVNGVINLLNISYTGSNADLIALRDDASGITTVNFTFVPAKSLATLKGSAASTTFSGTVTSVLAPDGGTTAILLGMGFLGLGALARRKS